MKRIMIVLIGVFFVISLNQAVAKPITLKFSTNVPTKANPVRLALKPWCDLVTKESKGSLKVDLYAGGVLGKNVRMYFQQLDTGVFDIALLASGYFGDRFSDMTFIYLPFMADTYLEAALGIQRMHDKGLLHGVENYKVLMNVGSSPFYINTTFPARVPLDVEGHKIRASNKIHSSLLTALGVTPYDIPPFKAAESLSRGMIEGTVESPSSSKAFGTYKIARNHLLVPMGSVNLLIVMNKAKYESLPPQAKATIDQFSGEFLARFWADALTPPEEKDLENWDKDPKHTVVVPTAGELQKWQDALRPTVEKWKKANPRGAELLKLYQAELDKIRADN